MNIQIEDERVRRNVLFFLHLLSLVESAKESQESHQKKVKVYSAFLNTINGEIFFPDLLPESGVIHDKEWKQITIRSSPISKTGELGFVLEEEQISSELAPLAASIVRSTLDMLSQVSNVMKKTQTIQSGLAELARLHIQKALSSLENCPLHRLSRSLTRWQAEEILSRHPYGSFLFRKDEYASLLEEQLSQLHERNIVCYTLTYSEPSHKIVDLTLVKDGSSLIVYDDDLLLEGNRYESLAEALGRFEGVCKYPLF